MSSRRSQYIEILKEGPLFGRYCSLVVLETLDGLVSDGLVTKTETPTMGTRYDWGAPKLTAKTPPAPVIPQPQPQPKPANGPVSLFDF